MWCSGSHETGAGRSTDRSLTIGVLKNGRLRAEPVKVRCVELRPKDRLEFIERNSVVQAEQKYILAQSVHYVPVCANIIR